MGFEPRVVVFRQQRSDECSELSEWLGVLDDDDDDDQDPRLQELLGLGGVGRRYGTGRLRALHRHKPQSRFTRHVSRGLPK